MRTPDITGLPDIILTNQGAVAQQQLVTGRNVAYVVEQCGFVVRLNMMTAGVEFYHPNYTDLRHPDTQVRLEADLLDMCTRMRMKSRETVRELLAVQARQNAYHPMEEWLQGLASDGGEHIQTLVDSVTTDNELWPVYLENWLVQVVEGVCGWRDRSKKKSLPYVLVLVGGQGVGKSHWLKTLGGEWLKGEAELHLSAPSGKDHQLAALKFPMVELAELDGIFRKADISHMKSFISREEDEIRAPYERRALVRPRMTTFCGSVNESEFLTDTTGSRRFWPVGVEHIDWDIDIDWDQLWAQAYEMWQESNDFNLGPQEEAARIAVATEQHTQISAEAELFTEYLRVHNGHAQYPELVLGRAEILQMLYGKGRPFSNKMVSDFGRVVESLLGRASKIDGKKRSWRVPYNEFAIDSSTWPKAPGPDHLKLV